MKLAGTILVGVCVAARGGAAAPFAVDANLLQTRAHPGDSVDVELRVVNASDVRQSFVTWSCSWPMQWQSDTDDIDAPLAHCSWNAEETVVLEPGKARTWTLTLGVARKATPGSHTFELGFSPTERKPATWSNKVTLELVR